MGIEKLILKLVEDQSVLSALTLLITTACGLGVVILNNKRAQLMDMAKGTKRSSIRTEYLQIYNATEFTAKEKWEMTRHIVKEYFDVLQGNHYIHGLDKKLEEKLREENKHGKRNK